MDKFKVNGEIKVGGSVKVFNEESGNAYDITIGKDNVHACSCPAFQFKGTCKHVDHIVSLQQAQPKEEEDTGFVVKGRPAFLKGTAKSTVAENLALILKQKIEESKERNKGTSQVKALHPNSEFQPEQIPFIPDSDHPLLSKHDLATPERNAGFQDASMVHPMYKDMVRPAPAPEAGTVTETTLEINTTMSPSKNNGIITGTKPKTEPRTNPAPETAAPRTGQLPEFNSNMPRQNMHRGGHYVPNESRPYRPGDTK